MNEVPVHPHGQIKLGFFPLPVSEAERLRSCLKFPAKFSAFDPCVGDGRASRIWSKETKPIATALKLTPIALNRP